MPLRRKLTIALALVLGIAFVVVAVALVAYFMAVYRPSGYAPVPLSSAQQEQAEAWGWQKSQDLYNQVYLSSPFTIVFEETPVNHLLLHDDTVELTDRLTGGVSRRIGPVQVDFRPGVIAVMAQVTHESRTFVLTARVRPSITPQGRLQIVLLPVKVGALSLPRALAQDRLGDLLAAFQTELARPVEVVSGTRGDARQDVLAGLRQAVLPALDELLRTGRVELTPVFEADVDRDAQLIAVQVDDDRLVLGIRPLVDAAAAATDAARAGKDGTP